MKNRFLAALRFIALLSLLPFAAWGQNNWVGPAGGGDWNTADRIVGELFGAAGVLEILGGGSVSNAIGCIGNAAGRMGTVTVSGANSTWTNTSWLAVGLSSSGNTLTIEAGGRVSNTGGYLGSSDNHSVLVRRADTFEFAARATPDCSAG